MKRLAPWAGFAVLVAIAVVAVLAFDCVVWLGTCSQS